MSQFQNFIAGMPMSIPPRINVFPAKGGVNFPKGATVFIKGGFAILAVTGDAASRKLYVCVKAVDNTLGADGAVGVSVVGSGQIVTILIGANTLNPGDGVKVSGTANAVDLHVAGIDDQNLLKGHFIGIEPGVYSKSGISPYNETFTTNSNPEAAGTTGTIGVIELW